ncbi:MAG TPA: M56 family metallopeptidase [Terracidiphilus sp.]|nr:M56 family metallopeptidase [Terracidiphilus sp.]
MHLTAYLDLALRALHGTGHTIPAAWSTFSQPAAALVLTAVWQGAVVALGLAFCLRLAPRSPARHRFAMWAAGFGVLVALQVVPLLMRLFPVPLRAIPGVGASAAFSVAGSHPWFRLNLNVDWSLVITALWLTASLFRAADLAIHSLRLRKLWKSAVPVAIDPASLPRSLGRLSRRTLQICTTGELERPSVIGFFAPRILIPDWLFSRLTPGELDQIVLHETEHLRRCDDWTNLLQKLCLVLFPLNPGLAWIERRLCREREMACDDGVIRVTRAPRAYAACLASLAEHGLQRRAGALSLGAWHARPELVRRVHSILRRRHPLNPFAARAVLAAVACILLAGASELVRCPRLIAFVPAHTTDAAPHPLAEEAAVSKNQNPAMEELAPLKERPAVAESGVVLKGHAFSRADHGSTPSRASANEGIAPHSRAHAIASKAVARTPASRASSHGAADLQLASLATKSASFSPGPVCSADLAPGSAFIVMSAWEGVEFPSPEAGRKQARSKTAQLENAMRIAGPENALAVQRISPRITVTRMYLKIYSAGGKESTWLVLQL